MLTLEQIITEADTLVPNAYTEAEKVPWLNAINHEFFDVVKIPRQELFESELGAKTYTLTAAGIKGKSIDMVQIGHLKYKSLGYDTINPGENWFTFDEASKLLTLSSPCSMSGKTGIVRYYQAAVTSFTTGGIATQQPDAPEEHHWIYVLGLAKYIANAQEDESGANKAAVFGKQYRDALDQAANNYLGGVSFAKKN